VCDSRAYVFSGATGALVHTLTSPNGENRGRFGSAAAAVPDVDGDGLDDLVVGAFGETVGGVNDAGRAYVFSGASGVLVHTLVSPEIPQLALFGYRVAGVPDADGDGRGDVFVLAQAEDGPVPDCGAAHLFSGATGAHLLTVHSPNAHTPNSGLEAVAGAPDLDGDGRGDLLVGAPYETVNGVAVAGRAYVFSGGTGELLHALAPDTANGSLFFAPRVAGMPDVDQDGRGDFVVGHPLWRGPGVPTAGRVLIVSGATGSPLVEVTAPDSTAFAFGEDVAGIPDVDGDGLHDVLVGAGSAHPDRVGRAYTVSSATGAVLGTFNTTNPQEDGFFGRWVTGVPDVDADGRGDVLVGAPGEMVVGVQDVGRAYLYSGGVTTAAEEAPSANGVTVTVAPNPTASGAGVAVLAAVAQAVRVSVSDMLGRELAVLHDGQLAAGRHEFRLEGAALPPGVYLVRVVTPRRSVTRPVALVR
jgi:hypothetical protein